jgi:hypothetical protein
MIHKPSLQPSRSAVAGASRLLAATALVAVTLAPAAQASTVIAYSFPGPQAGNQPYTQAMGSDFTVNTPITVTSLLAFDHNADGFTAGTSIEVGIFTQAGVQVGASQVFTGSAGVVKGGSYRSLPVSINLPAGNYSIVGQGFNSNDPNYNIGFTPFVQNILNTGGGQLTFGTFRYEQSFAGFGFPTTVGPNDTTPDELNRFGVASFEFTAVPEPAGVGTLLVGLGMFGFASRRRRTQFSA